MRAPEIDRHKRSLRLGSFVLLIFCLTGCSEAAGLRSGRPQIQTLEPSAAISKIVIITSDETTAPEDTLPAETEPPAQPEEPSTAAENKDDALIDITPGKILSEEDVALTGTDAFFWQAPLDDATFARIYGKSYRDGCPVSREDLRYMQLLHYDLEGNIHVGEMISNRHITDVLLSVFRQLYDARYPIEKMILVDEYDANDEASSSDNNTSCFNFRSVANTNRLSYHARGLAVNINPLYNPYIISGYNTDEEKICTPAAGVRYLDRTQDFPYKIDPDDLCVRLFKEAGFTWGGEWKYTPDYMHFDCRGAGY